MRERFVNFCSARVCKGIAEKSGFLLGRSSFNSQALTQNDVGRENAGCIHFAPRSVGCPARGRRFWRELEICLVCSPAPALAHNGTRNRRNSPSCADVRGMLRHTTVPAANRMPRATSTTRSNMGNTSSGATHRSNTNTDDQPQTTGPGQRPTGAT